MGVKRQRFSTHGTPVDSTPFAIVEGLAGEPSVSVLSDGDYLIAFTDLRIDPRGDIGTRIVRRFGPPLVASEVALTIASAEAEQRPVIAAGSGTSFVIAYQRGAPASVSSLFGFGIDPSSLANAQKPESEGWLPASSSSASVGAPSQSLSHTARGQSASLFQSVAQSASTIGAR